MPKFQVTITRTQTVVLSFKAKDEDAAEEKVDDLLNGLDDVEFDDNTSPAGFKFESQESDSWELDSMDETD